MAGRGCAPLVVGSEGGIELVISALTVRDFRNIPSLSLEPSPGVNVIYGDNAQGKTNLVEALYLLTGQKSFRQTRETDLVRFGQKTANVSARFQGGGREQVVSLTLEGGKRAASLNELPVAVGELTGTFFAVVFSPAGLSLVRDGPSQRRAFLDGAISQVMPRYQRTMADLNRVLFQRNSLLNDINRRLAPDNGLLEVWDRSFSKLSYSVINARCRYLSRLAPFGEEIYRGISGGKEAFSMAYHPSIPGEWGKIKEEEGEKLIFSALGRARGDDLKNGCTTLGPHRDDLDLWVDGVAVRSYGSQGQQRSCALTLKLAECGVIREVAGEQPVILLDDVLSELDKARRDYLLSGLAEGQLFITCCERNGFGAMREGMMWRIEKGALVSKRRMAPKRPRPAGP